MSPWTHLFSPYRRSAVPYAHRYMSVNRLLDYRLSALSMMNALDLDSAECFLAFRAYAPTRKATCMSLTSSRLSHVLLTFGAG